ncbi:MAG TPA: c-type cytochrome [Gemmatimonadaceae bacterium]|jgi:tetratricopeptide (TPR) repeat protein
MPRIRILALVASAALTFPIAAAGAQNPAPGTPAGQQGPPPKPKNLKYFPKDIPMRALLDTMGTFTRALGVNCSFCHMAEENQPPAERDFASDQKPNKDKARTMLRMVAAINGDYLTKLSSRLQPPIVVSCATCHRGVAEPRPLDQVILTRYDSAGSDSAVALYRQLRQRYYGRASYDFGEAPLAEVGSSLRQQNHVADALKFYMLNLEYAPNSSSAWSQLGGAQLASGDTATAIKSFEKALSLNPNDRQATRALQALKPKP